MRIVRKGPCKTEKAWQMPLVDGNSIARRVNIVREFAKFALPVGPGGERPKHIWKKHELSGVFQNTRTVLDCCNGAEY